MWFVSGVEFSSTDEVFGDDWVSVRVGEGDLVVAVYEFVGFSRGVLIITGVGLGEFVGITISFNSVIEDGLVRG